MSGAGEPVDLGAYCRAIETYLCQRNHGHLVRVVGPAFDCVAGWAARGVPLRVAYRGIDRCVERSEAKATRRRPMRVEFCDADVLDVFDEWRRAVGVPRPPTPAVPTTAHARRQASLAAHLERVVARLTLLRASGALVLGDVVDPMVAELDAARQTAKGLRGDARRALLERLRALDAALVTAVRDRLDAGPACRPRRRGRRRIARLSRSHAAGCVRGRAGGLRRSAHPRSVRAADRRARMTVAAARSMRGCGFTRPQVFRPASSC